MIAFVISQIVGVTLFATLNYGFFCYIRYRRDQVIGKSEDSAKNIYVFYMTALGFMGILGIVYKYSYLRNFLNLDYYYHIINFLLIDVLHSLPIDTVLVV
jgi:hypothetical protein